jgi:TfoX/Sxy family transcriptional regulator of competence genes
MATSLDPLQAAADEAISSWPDVRAKQVFGHRGYVHGGKMFAFIADNGLSFKAATLADAEARYAAGSAWPFVYKGAMEMRGWPVVHLTTDEQLADALTAIRAAYEGVG